MCGKLVPMSTSKKYESLEAFFNACERGEEEETEQRFGKTRSDYLNETRAAWEWRSQLKGDMHE